MSYGTCRVYSLCIQSIVCSIGNRVSVSTKQIYGPLVVSSIMYVCVLLLVWVWYGMCIGAGKFPCVLRDSIFS